jgi:hypothetical protein
MHTDTSKVENSAQVLPCQLKFVHAWRYKNSIERNTMLSVEINPILPSVVKVSVGALMKVLCPKLEKKVELLTRKNCKLFVKAIKKFSS